MSRNCFRIEHSAPCPQSAFPSCWDIARRTGHEPKRLQRREFRPFFDTFRLSYLAGCQIVCCHSDRKCAEPATNRWNNYDCVGKFTKRELSKIQLLAAIQPIFDAQGPGRVVPIMMAILSINSAYSILLRATLLELAVVHSATQHPSAFH